MHTETFQFGGEKLSNLKGTPISINLQVCIYNVPCYDILAEGHAYTTLAPEKFKGPVRVLRSFPAFFLLSFCKYDLDANSYGPAVIQ